MQDTETQSQQVEWLYALAARPPVDTAPTPPASLGYAAMSTEFNESVAAWGARMRTFGTVADSRRHTKGAIGDTPKEARPTNMMEDDMPKGNSHHRRCGVIDWHTGPTPNQCLGGVLHTPLDVDRWNLNTTHVERISSANGTETLVELPCRTSGETTRQ